jgi:hypothetical protein
MLILNWAVEIVSEIGREKEKGKCSFWKLHTQIS